MNAGPAAASFREGRDGNIERTRKRGIGWICEVHVETEEVQRVAPEVQIEIGRPRGWRRRPIQVRGQQAGRARRFLETNHVGRCSAQHRGAIERAGPRPYKGVAAKHVE